MRKRPLRFSTQMLLTQLFVLAVVCLLGIGAMAYLLRRDLIHEYEQRALSVAQAVAADPRFAAEVAAGDPDKQIQPQAEAVRRRTGALLVVVTDIHGIRYSHPDPGLIGKPVSLAEEKQALGGRTVVTYGSANAGPSARGKVPLRDATGRLVGEVIVGISARTLDAHLSSLTGKAAAFLAAALALGAAGAVVLSRRLRRQTLGLDPEGLRALWEQQAALRRVTTLVANGRPPGEVSSAVVVEVGRLLEADVAVLSRYETDGTLTVVARWGLPAGVADPGTRFPIDRFAVCEQVWKTGRPAHSDTSSEPRYPRIESDASSMGAPVLVEGRLWGALVVGWNHLLTAGPDVESRLAEFAELAATAIANAENRAELTASRARVVAAADRTRRRIERDLHDGTQQRLVSIGLDLRAAEAAVPVDYPALKEQLARSAGELGDAVEDLREISRGIHPAILSKGGLEAALKTLARRSALPVDVDIRVHGRYPEPVEVATYYVVSEALTNATKHAQASAVHVALSGTDGMVEISVRDDGVGGADPKRGTGLIGLCDRVEALGGKVEITSPPGGGTSLRATIPAKATG